VKTRNDSTAPDAQPRADAPAPRRIGRIVRDDRDTASVEWVDAPSDYPRVPLSIEGGLPPGAARPQGGYGGYDPYSTVAPVAPQPGAPKSAPRRDLRKLSQWIKQMRELEERKKRDP